MIRNSRRMVTLAVAGAVAIAPVITGCGAGATPQSAYPTQLTDGVNVSVPKNRPADQQVALRNMFLLAPPPGQPITLGMPMPLYGVLINQVGGQQDRLVSVTSTAFSGKATLPSGGLVLPGAAPDGKGTPVMLLSSAPTTPSPATQQGQPHGQKPGQQQGQQPTGAQTGSPSGRPTGTATAPTTAPTTAVPSGEQPLVVLPGLKQEVLPGGTVPVQMQFEKAGSVTFEVPFVTQQDEYATFPLASPVGQPTGATSPTSPTGPQGSPGTEQSPGATGNPEPTTGGEPGTSPSPTTTASPGTGGH